MYKKILSVLVPILILFSISAYSIAQQINFQGRLTSPSGTPETTPVDITFNIYEVGGINYVWTESWTGVKPDNNGTFSVLLGTTTPLDTLDFSKSYEIGVRVGNTDPEMSPRQKFGAVPYAFYAITAESLSGGGAGNYVLKTGDTMTGTLNLPANGLVAGTDQLVISGGKVGIGTTSPGDKLDIAGRCTIEATGNIKTAGTISEGGTLLSSKYVAIPGSSAQGDILMRDASGWTRLPAGASGQYLQTQGTGINPAWAAVAGGLGGSGATGYISKFTSASTLGNSVIYEDPSSSNVGIGTSTPGALLSLKKTLPINGEPTTPFTAEAINVNISTLQTANFTGLNINLGATTGVFNVGIARGLNIDVTGLPGTSGTGTVYGATIMGGNVGIGTTSPGQKLTVGAGNLKVMGSAEIGSSSCSAIGQDSVAMGTGTTASGFNSIAMGDTTTASGHHSTAMGYYTSASGNSSTAMGQYTSASGIGSAAMGRNTTVSGWYSTAMGYYTYAQPYASLAIGRYNIISGDSVTWVETDPLFIIGNGTNEANRSNAVTALKNGNVGIGTAEPSVKLDVAGEVRSTVGGVEFYMVPKGAIIMWSGLLSNIPTSWALCDGTNGTPDLRDKFIMGVQTGENPGATGGSSSYYLSAAQLPAHGHRFTMTSNGAHTNWTYYPGFANQQNGNQYMLSMTFATSPINIGGDGSHSHTGTVDEAPGDPRGYVIDNRPAFYKLAFIMKL